MERWAEFSPELRLYASVPAQAWSAKTAKCKIFEVKKMGISKILVILIPVLLLMVLVVKFFLEFISTLPK
ncbi:MAG: hypothetical protein WA139_05880 [Candidatus Aenigmatarchaeota archaeon]